MNRLNFGDIEVSKVEFYDSKVGIKLKHVNVNEIVVSSKMKINDDINKVLLVILMKVLFLYFYCYYK